jgi:exodeoxyribonuclease VII small subunit
MESNITLTYTQAMEELEAILASLEKSETVNLDAISQQVQRASELMAFCRTQLHTLDEELQKMVEQLS